MNENINAKEDDKTFSLRIEAEANDGTGTIVYKFDSVTEEQIEALNNFALFVLNVK